jgi:multisubunit Na+/H+ antiporter MnhB subunit
VNVKSKFNRARDHILIVGGLFVVFCFSSSFFRRFISSEFDDAKTQKIVRTTSKSLIDEILIDFCCFTSNKRRLNVFLS